MRAESAASFLAGLQAAQAAIPTAKARSRPADDTGGRPRELTSAWKQILGFVRDKQFNYDHLATAAEAADHDASRETLRSQMSLYKARGFVVSVGNGEFRLTDAGREAVGPPPAAKKPAFGGGNYADDLDDDVPF